MGGHQAKPGEIGWQAALFEVYDGEILSHPFCGGTLVDAERGWVVTAAHCVTTYEFDEDTEPEEADEEDEGDHWIPVPPELMRVSLGSLRLSELVVEDFLQVERVLVHPGYDDIHLQNDIALVQVRGVDPGASTARIAGSCSRAEPRASTTRECEAWVRPGRLALASGWGSTLAEPPAEDEPEEESPPVNAAHAAAHRFGRSAPAGDIDEEGFPDTLRWVTVPIAPQARCAAVTKTPEDPELAVTDTMICAGSLRGGRDTCSGDSGGPLVVFDSHARPVLVGITSWGLGCAWPGTYGIYTRVSSFADWLEGCMEAPEACSGEAVTPE